MTKVTLMGKLKAKVCKDRFKHGQIFRPLGCYAGLLGKETTNQSYAVFHRSEVLRYNAAYA
jgi:hypothetical protein